MSQVGTKLLERFSNDFAQLLESEYDYNVIIKVGKDSFKLHSLVLYQRSSYFRQELSTATKKNNIIEIMLTDTSAETFKILIKYIYTGVILFEKYEPSAIFDLLIPSNKLNLGELVEYIQSYLIDNHASWLRLKFNQVCSIVFQADNFKILETFCSDVLVKHPKLIFDSEEFTSIQEKALVTLLKRDDLQIEESEIWDKVIEWGKAQTPNLPSDLKQWNDKDFLALKTSLDNCIPLIRYFQMSGEDLVRKVRPYRQILESNLWDDITSRIMAPNLSISSTILPARKIIPVQLPVRETSFVNESLIINEEHAAEISSWIDRLSSIYDIKKIPYKFKLLLRGSRDGFTYEPFHRLCDNIPRTLIVMKINGTNEILGGYNPLVWSSDNPLKWYSTTESFIFSLKTPTSPNSNLIRIIHERQVIGCHSQRGPVFCCFNSDRNGKNWAYSYSSEHHEKRLRDSSSFSFLIDELEVFQILKN